ncbi:MAG TPA: restriction endonuclease fold toxin, partial [Candidatus Dependentiae bacterium]|nr:restriction endonuclease fold toxin [Candidatus Dependentiae bacterium]
AQGVQAAEEAPKLTEPGQAHEVQAVEETGPYSGKLIKVPKPDAGADALARKLNGESCMKFSGDPIGKEFDVISNEFIAES